MSAATYNRTATFAAACTGMAMFGISMIIIGALLPILEKEHSLTVEQNTAIVAFLPLSILAGSILFGPICDRYGYRALFLASCTSVIAGMVGLTCTGIVPLLQVCVIAIGLGGGILNGATNAMVADIYDGKQRGARLSLLGAFYGIGSIGIPLLTGLFDKYFDYTNVVRGIAAVLALCTIASAFATFPAPTVHQGFPMRKALGMAKDKVLLLLSFILFLESGIEGATNNWTTMYLDHTSTITPALAMQALTAMLVALTMARLVQAALLRYINRDVFLLSCFGFAALGFAGLWIFHEWWTVMLSMILIGIGISATFPVVLADVGSRYPAMVGTAFGLAMTIALTGNFLINSLTGLTCGYLSWGAFPPIMLACVAAMALLMAVHISGRKKHQP